MKCKSINIVLICIVFTAIVAANTQHNCIELKSFDLINRDGKRRDLKDLSNTKAVIYIFSKKCILCEKNIYFWNRIAKKFIDRDVFYGIILGDRAKSQALLASKKIDFALYEPSNISQFLETNNINDSQSHTIITRNKKILFFKTGDLDSQDYFDILKILEKGEINK